MSDERRYSEREIAVLLRLGDGVGWQRKTEEGGAATAAVTRLGMQRSIPRSPEPDGLSR